jgi:flagellar assembly factor FliW
MKIITTRFGELEVTPDDILEFSEGLLGFGHLRRFIILDDPNDDIFAWLQSCESPEIAFPVLEPELFAPNYQVDLTKTDLEALRVATVQDTRLLTIITIPTDPTQMTANLKAPIVINPKRRSARQVVLQDNALPIREPIFSKLQQRVVQNPNAAFKTQAQDIGIVRIQRRAPDIEV